MFAKEYAIFLFDFFLFVKIKYPNLYVWKQKLTKLILYMLQSFHIFYENI